MRELIPIIAASIRNNLRVKTVILLVAVTVIFVIGVTAIFCIISIEPSMEQLFPDRAALELYLGLIIYSACLMGLGINLNSFAFQSMTREKARGNIESLLATPLRAKEIWLAKSLAVFLPGLVLGVALALVTLVAVNYIYFVPSIGFLVNPWIAVNSFVAAPLVYLLLSLLVHLVGLTGKPVTGNVIAQVFLPVFTSLMINLATHNVINAASWSFTLANLGAAAAIGAIVILLQPRLTRERIVLSG
jgi:ABC-2 type transport system permease protein